MRKHEFCDGWILAMEEEYKSLFEMGVFIDIPRSEMSPGRVPMTCRWVYTYKESPDGLITALKARFVVRGFEQKKYIDFDETFAHVPALLLFELFLLLRVRVDMNFVRLILRLHS